MIPILLVLLQAGTPATLGTPPAENVLVIVADDFGWSERALLTSLDEIASRGVTFERFYAWPLCSPTREALLHGELPRRTGVGGIVRAHDGDAQPVDRLSLPEALGWRSALIGKGHLGRADVLPGCLTSGFLADGFEHWLAGSPESINRPHAGAGHYDWFRVDDAAENAHASTYSTAAQLAEFCSWWPNGGGFCLLAWSAPHSPYDVPPGGTSKTSTRAYYEQSIAYLDGAMDEVLAQVDWEETLVIFLGDNGTPNDARPTGTPAGQWKNTTYEGGIRVPLIVAGAGVTQTGTSQRLVSAVDIAATVLELAGREAPRGFADSRSFANALGSWTGTAPREWVMAERYGSSGEPDDLAIVTDEWKLRVYDFNPGDFSPPSVMLHHLPDQAQYNPDAYPAVRDSLNGYLATLPPRQ